MQAQEFLKPLQIVLEGFLTAVVPIFDLFEACDKKQQHNTLYSKLCKLSFV